MSLSAQQLAAQKNISWVLAEKLAQKILTGEYQPESILPGEMELGEQFGVSRTARPRSGEDAYCKRHAAAPPSHWHPGDAAQQLEFP